MKPVILLTVALHVLVLGGVAPALAVVTTDLVGEPLSGYPGFEYVTAVQRGLPVTIAFDPSPGGHDAACDVYVVAAKAAKTWHNYPQLVDVRPSGPELHEFQCTDNQTCRLTLREGQLLSGAAGCLQPGNLSSCIGLGVPYDVVLDCDQDGLLGGDDIIDGLGDDAGFWVVHDTTQSRLPVNFLNLDIVGTNPSGNEYGLPSFYLQAPCTGDSFDERLAFPQNIAAVPGSLPLIVISHGNGHCYPNYDYLMGHLASYGYVVMSHANNTHPGVGGNDGTGGAAETTLKHTDAVLDLLTSPDCASRIVGTAHDAVCGRVDPTRLVWIGHSRGGGGVVWARTRLAADPTDPIHYDPQRFDPASIRLISAMAPIDAEIAGSFAEPGVVPFHLIWGSGDKDVSGRPGSDSEAFSMFDRADGPRQSVYIHGGAHGWFHEACNGEATLDCSQAGSSTVSEAGVHAIVKGYVIPLVKRYLDANVPAQDFLWRPWARFHPGGAPASAQVALEYRVGAHPGRFVIDDFQTQAATTTSSSGGAVTQTLDPSGSDPDTYLEGLFDDEDCHFDWIRGDGGPGVFDDTCPDADVCEPGGMCPADRARSTPGGGPCKLACTLVPEQPMNAMTRSKDGSESRGVAFGWTNGLSRSVEFEIVPGERDLSGNEFLSFRAAQMPRHPLTISDIGDLDCTVSLRDGAGSMSEISLASLEAGIVEPYERMGPYEVLNSMCCGGHLCVVPDGCDHTFSGSGWQAEFETVRIRLRDFTTERPDLDLTDIEAVRFDFGAEYGSSVGRIALDDLEFTAGPKCPQESLCVGPSCVASDDVLATQDTGLTACVRDNGEPFACSTGRIHLVARSCSKGACCRQRPACFCPSGPCPNSMTLECQ